MCVWYVCCVYGVCIWCVCLYVYMYLSVCLSVCLCVYLCMEMYIQIQTRTSSLKCLRKPSLLLLCGLTGCVMKPTSWDWREDSVVKSTGYCPGPRFNSQHPHDGSQPPVTPVPGDPMSSSGFRHTCRQSTRMQNKNLKKLFKNQTPPMCR